MKKLTFALLSLTALVALTALTGYGKYVSHYKATMQAYSNDSTSATLSFGTLEGTHVFKLKSKTDGTWLRYSGKLGAGTLTVFCDCNGKKEALFTVTEDGEIGGTFKVPKGTVYVIIETDGKCENGSFEFRLVNP